MKIVIIIIIIVYCCAPPPLTHFYSTLTLNSLVKSSRILKFSFPMLWFFCKIRTRFKSNRDSSYCAWILFIWNDLSRYTIEALLNLRINGWLLNWSNPCRVRPSRDIDEELNQTIGLYINNIQNIKVLTSKYKSSDFKI